LSDDGFAAYRQFREAYKLEVIQRQSGDSEEQRNFREILLRLSNGELTKEDWGVLTSRVEDKQPEKNATNSPMPYLLPTWFDVNLVYMGPVAKTLAVHTGGKEAKEADSDTAKGLKAQLLLVRGACIMLTANQAGLVNGSMETVQDIIFND
jgi:hypothetical protein